jgi:hypothetical protein
MKKFELIINLKTAKALGPDPSRSRRRGDRVRRREVITLHATIESEQRDSRINVAHSRVNPAMLCSKSRQSWAELYAFE